MYKTYDIFSDVNYAEAKPICACLGCVWLIAVVLCIVGSVMLDNNLQFKRDSTKSTCTIISVTSHSCSYDCHCYKDKDGHEHCDTCYGYTYDYTTTSPVCGTKALTQKSDDSNGSCPQTQKSMNYGYTCWVECDDGIFSFSSPGELIGWSIFMIVLGGCCCCCGSGFACNRIVCAK